MNENRPTDMTKGELAAVLCIAFFSFTGYHAYQPLFPQIGQSYSLPASSVSLITTCMILPVGIAPIFYGVLLTHWPLLPTLATAICLHSLTLLPAPLNLPFIFLLACRITQGLTLAAIMVCVMTYIAARFQGLSLQRAMSFYAFFVITGSFSGRLISGCAETWLSNWRLALLANFLTAFLALPLCLLLKNIHSEGKSPDFRAIGRLLRQKNMLLLLLLPTAALMASTSILQMIPFRLKKIDPQISSLAISLVYTGVLL